MAVLFHELAADEGARAVRRAAGRLPMFPHDARPGGECFRFFHDALQVLGHFMIPIAAMRREGTSQSYVDLSYPAVADVELVNVMNETVQQMGKRYLNGLNCTMDGFYSCMHDSKFSLECGRDMSKTFEEVKKLGVTGIDMESSCILTLGRLMGVKTCILTVVTVLENLKETLKGQDRVDAEDLLCRTALEGIYNYHIKREDGKNE